MNDLSFEKIFAEHDSRQWGIKAQPVLSAAEKKRRLLAMPKGSKRPQKRKHLLGLVLVQYTNTKSNMYDPRFDKVIRKRFPHWFANIAEENKKKLLAMPKESSRPSHNHPLGNALCRYTNPKNPCYDPEFYNKISKKQPNWFIKTSDENKKKLLAMPKGSPRPTGRMGALLCAYICKTHECYDHIFDSNIRNKFPYWFVSQSDKANDKKRKLLSMPKGALRPKGKKSSLGSALTRYTNPKNSCYDPEFDKSVRKRFPHWFVTRSELANEKKIKLLAMPKDSKRPVSKKHVLGYVLIEYTTQDGDSYDPVFDKKIRQKHPTWFIDTVGDNKMKLLSIKRGSRRPSSRSSLGARLVDYTKDGGNMYDPAFAKAIKQKQPNWFIKTSDENKKKLLAMPKGSPRPDQRKHKLGAVLSAYTRVTHNSYDPDFTKKIKKIHPQWFVSRKDISYKKKQKLLTMPKGSPRPNSEHPLGGALISSYVGRIGRKNDPDFYKAIRERHPSWFNKVANKKNQLLAMGKKSIKPYRDTPLGDALHRYTNPRRKSYDPVFDKAVRKRFPAWFITQYDKATKKKQKLMSMLPGVPRPNQRKHPLGTVLCFYTNSKSETYDPEFDRAIRRRQPGWFGKKGKTSRSPK